MSDSYRRITLWNPRWSTDDVLVAVSRTSRRVGLGFVDCDAVVMRTSSIQTFTMSSPINVCEIDDSGRVLTSRLVPPGRIVVFRSRRWVLETDSSIGAPAVGIVLRVLPSRRDGRNTHPLRDTDREPPGSV